MRFKNVLHISTHASGGAGKAVMRFHTIMLNNNINSKVVFKIKSNDDSRNVFSINDLQRPKSISFYFRKLKNKINYFRFKWLKIKTAHKYYFYNPIEKLEFCDPEQLISIFHGETIDAIFIYWISWFANSKTVYDLHKYTSATIYIVPLDMSLMTGGCHYSGECTKYMYNCEQCPAILSNGYKSLAQENLLFKQKYYYKTKHEVIAVSEELNDQLKKSKLFHNSKIKKVYIPIPLNVFKPINKSEARKKLNIPIAGTLIFIGASSLQDERKGVRYAIEAFKILKEEYKMSFQILLAGKDEFAENMFYPIPEYRLGFIENDQQLALAYQAADFFLCTSIEDSGPMMINESLATGRPIVAFKVGVAKDLVIENQTGFLAQNISAFDLAQSLKLMLQKSEEESEEMSKNARNLALQLMSPKRIISDIFL